MKITAITGGIGCGKSTVSEYLGDRFALTVIDADAICRTLYESPAVAAELGAAFGEGILNAAGQVDRNALARKVFADQAALAELEAYAQPRIHDRILTTLRRLPETASVLLDAPLLYESGWDSLAEKVIAVWAPPAIQFRRLQERGLSDDQIRRRIAAQLPAVEKLNRADYALINDGPLEALYLQCDRLSTLFEQTTIK